MKAINPAALRNCAIVLVLIFLVSEATQAQAPLYRFKNATHISGSAGQVNAVYRFPNVKPGGGPTVDALVKITARVGNITLQNIDRTADGYDEAFQPEYKVGPNTDAYIEFQISFVKGGTSNMAPQPLVEVSGLDIDGSGSGGGVLTSNVLKEFNRVDMGGGLCSFNALGSQLTISQIGTAYEGKNFTGQLFGALVDTAAKEVMFSVHNVNVTSFTYRVGANSSLSSNSTRYASLYFKRFFYPDQSVLSAPMLHDFNGVLAGEKTKLQWSLTESHDVNSIVLEKSYTGTSFDQAAIFWLNNDTPVDQRNFNYTDNITGQGKVYYRLKITSHNGKVQYSQVLFFDAKKTAAATLTVYPSLVTSSATVSLHSAVREAGVVIVTDMAGRVVKQQPVMLQQGTNNIVIPGFDQFRKGNYIVAVSTAQQKLARQVVVQ